MEKNRRIFTSESVTEGHPDKICDQIMAVGSTLVENGEISENNSDGMRLDRHPRTCVGVKEDGTLMFFTIDGRQQANNMYGMNQDEQGAMMKYYGCYLGFNVDGGGSTTMGIRDENGDFVIVNSPSDGHERSVANVILVVVPSVNLKIDKLTDESITFAYDELSKGLSVSNIVVNVGNITQKMTGNKIEITSLKPETTYDYFYTYDVTYRNKTFKNTSKTKQFTTAKILPRIRTASYDVVDNEVIIKHDLTDENNLTTLKTINYSPSGVIFLNDLTIKESRIALTEIDNLNITIRMYYTTESVPNMSDTLIEQIIWCPKELDLNSVPEALKKPIDDVLNKITDDLLELNKAEQLTKINDSRSVVLEEYQKIAIAKLQEMASKNSYSKSNQKRINNIITEAKSAIDSANTYESINTLYEQSLTKIGNIKVKGCNSKNVAFSIMLGS